MPKVIAPSARTAVANDDGTFSREWYLYLDEIAKLLTVQDAVEPEKTPEELNLLHLQEIIAFERIVINPDT